MIEATGTDLSTEPGGVASSALPKSSVPEDALTRCLHELPDCVVLRNEEDLFENLQRGGDVDLLVGDLERAERALIRHLGPPVRIIRSSYVRGYSYDWGHIDLLPTIEWRGACYFRTEAVLDGRRLSARGRPVARMAHEAVISWLTSLLWGGFFKDRYQSVIRQAVEADGPALRQALQEAAGKKWGDRLWGVAVDGHPALSANWVRPLRRAVWFQAWLKSPVQTIRRSFAFVVRELRLRFEPPVPWIAILAADGRVKSSVAQEIVQRFAATPYANIKALRWRPRLARWVQGTDRMTRLVLAADRLVGYWTRVIHLRAKGYIVAFDRTYFNLAIDDHSYRDESSPVGALWWLLPKPDLVFVLDSTPALCHRNLADQYSLNSSLPPTVLAAEIQRVIRAWMVARTV